MESKASRTFTYMILFIFLLLVLIPMAWGIANAFRSNEEIAAMSGLGIYSFIPRDFTLQNFIKMFSKLNFGRVMLNTVFVSLTVTIASVMINAMAGYAFARLNFPGKHILFIILLTTLMVPIEVLIIPLYGTMRSFDMIDKYSALIVPFLANAFGIFFMRQFIKNVPKELDEAGIVDGCSLFGIFLKIMLPLLKPAMITLGIIVFLQQWDSFIVPVTVMHSKEKMVLQVALSNLQFGLYSNDYGIMFAGMVVAALPVIIVFLFLQKYYVEGISSSGLKG